MIIELSFYGMRVIQERDGGDTPNVSYMRGSDLSGSMEGLPRERGQLSCKQSQNS
jgi:hypothetical protein